MNTQDTLQELQKLKLHGMAKRYEAVLGQSAHEQPEPHMLVALLTEAESVYRIHQRTQLYLRGFPGSGIMPRLNRLIALPEEG